MAKHKMTLKFWEDNSAAQSIMETGRNPKIRHINRTQKVNVRWLHDVFEMHKQHMKLMSCPTKEMKADIFTKAFPAAKDWVHACNLIGFVIPDGLQHSGTDDYDSLPTNRGAKKGAPVISLAAAYSSGGQSVVRMGNKCCEYCCPKNLQVVNVM